MSAVAIGFDCLDAVALTDEHREAAERLGAHSAGSPAWRARKAEAVRDLFALSQIAPRDRLRVLALDATEEVRALLHLGVTVPCLPPGGSDLLVAHGALLELRYPAEIMTADLPGTAFAVVREPRHVWHANCDHALGALCLGARLPRNIPLREIVWLAYTALAMQVANFDDRDPAGVLNRRAAHWWSVNRARLPLTRTALLEDRPL